MAGKIETLDIIGLPPSDELDKNLVLNSMPVASIKPALPSRKAGLSTFKLDTNKGWQKYTEILTNHNVDCSNLNKCVKLAFVADNFPSDTFTNEYGESFLERMSNVVSGGISDISQMSGSRTGSQTLKNLSKDLGTAARSTGGIMGNLVGGAAGVTGSAISGLGKLANSLTKESPFLASHLRTINRSLAGGRVDFPHVWKGSSFNPSYTMTVKLINPYPASDEATLKYIVGPLTEILSLGLAQSEDGQVFSWPFFHKIKCKGLYNLPTAVITSITVIKGGDQQQIAWNQRPSVVDVRIDFSSLYSILMVKTGTGNEDLERPTLKNYVNGLIESKQCIPTPPQSTSTPTDIITKYGLKKSRPSGRTTAVDRLLVQALAKEMQPKPSRSPGADIILLQALDKKRLPKPPKLII